MRPCQVYAAVPCKIYNRRIIYTFRLTQKVKREPSTLMITAANTSHGRYEDQGTCSTTCSAATPCAVRKHSALLAGVQCIYTYYVYAEACNKYAHTQKPCMYLAMREFFNFRNSHLILRYIEQHLIIIFGRWLGSCAASSGQLAS